MPDQPVHSRMRDGRLPHHLPEARPDPRQPAVRPKGSPADDPTKHLLTIRWARQPATRLVATWHCVRPPKLRASDRSASAAGRFLAHLATGTAMSDFRARYTRPRGVSRVSKRRTAARWQCPQTSRRRRTNRRTARRHRDADSRHRAASRTRRRGPRASVGVQVGVSGRPIAHQVFR